MTGPSLSLTVRQSPPLVNRIAGKKFQKYQSEMTYVIKTLQNCLPFIAATKSWWGGGRERRISRTTAFYFYFPFILFSVISLLDTVCVSYSTHKKAEKHARKGEIFSVSLFLGKLQMSSSVFSPFNERYAHPSSSSHFPVMMSGRPYSISFVIL